MQSLKIAGIQSNLFWEDADANLRHFDELLARLRQSNDLIVLPETFTTGFPVDPRRFAQKEDGTSMQWMASRAAKLNAVLCGSMLMQRGDAYYNTLVWMRPDGSYELYDKRHVFRMGGEHKQINPGQDILSVELKGWNIRPLICYDLRFPIWARNSYADGKWAYDLAVYVASWPSVRAYPWQQLLIARAIENQSYVVGVNRVGKDGIGNEYSGDSAVIDAKGYYVAQATPSEEVLMETEIKAEDLYSFREKFNVGLDWDAYKILHLPVDSQ